MNDSAEYIQTAIDEARARLGIARRWSRYANGTALVVFIAGSFAMEARHLFPSVDSVPSWFTGALIIIPTAGAAGAAIWCYAWVRRIEREILDLRRRQQILKKTIANDTINSPAPEEPAI